jgi:CheY-like chemotaxis protein
MEAGGNDGRIDVLIAASNDRGGRDYRLNNLLQDLETGLRDEKPGLRIETAIDGKEALEIARRSSSSIILMQYNLPRKSGCLVAESLLAGAGEDVRPNIILLHPLGSKLLERYADSIGVGYAGNVASAIRQILGSFP